MKACLLYTSITGSTGAGVKPGATSHFSWRNNNMSVYKAFDHQHVPEIKQSLKQLQNSFDSDIDFIPYRGDFARGIFATMVRCVEETVNKPIKISITYRLEVTSASYFSISAMKSSPTGTLFFKPVSYTHLLYY